MITIKITNIEAIVEKQKGWFVAHVVGSVIDLEARVEGLQGLHAQPPTNPS